MLESTQMARALPRYQCFKEVCALKIADIQLNESAQGGKQNATIVPVESGYSPFTVDWEYMQKHKPEIGGYFVMYKDGYTSFSPAKAFEEGYRLI